MKRTAAWKGLAVAACVLGLGLNVEAQASLIGDTIVINSGIPNTACNFTVDCEDTVVVGGGAELISGDSSDFGQALVPFPTITASVDVMSESIDINFSVGGVFTFIFSDLHWLDEMNNPLEGTLNGVTLSPSGNTTLSSPLTVTNLSNDAIDGASFRTVLDCNPFLNEDPCVPGTPFTLDLDVTHVPEEPVVPEPSAFVLAALALLTLLAHGRRRRRA